MLDHVLVQNDTITGSYNTSCFYLKVAGLLKKMLTIFCLFYVSNLSAQKLTAPKAIDKVKEIVNQSSSKQLNKNILDFLTANQEKAFVDDENYNLFLNEVDTFFNESQDHYLDVLFFLGRRFQLSKQDQNAFPYLYKIELLISPEKSYAFECEFYELMGLSYFFFKRYEQSKMYLNKSLNCGTTTEHAKINILNTLGLIYSLSDLEKSENYYKTAIDLAKRTNNTAWTGVLSGNLGVVYYNKQQYELARTFLNTDFKMSKAAGEIESALSAMSKLIEIDIVFNEGDALQKKIQTVDSIVSIHPKMQKIASYYESKAAWYEYTHDYGRALEFYKKHQHVNDSINRLRNIVNSNNTEFQIDFEHRQAKIQVLQEQSRTNRRIMIGLIILASTIAIGAYISILQILKRKKKEKELLELKNKRVKENLEKTEQEMQFVLKSLMEKNDTIAKMSEELETLFLKMDRTEEEYKDLTDRLQSFTLLTDEDWLQFKHLFEKRYPGFFEFFYTNYEDITNAELRLAALLKLNLENLEISKALGIGPDSVRKTNLRLRKRLDIAEQKDLQKLIQSIA
jgi:Pyruvate/2-oxoacid:ferredoxin oxidoreductase gamma subunit/DNA-binding CsgD family transcriptional regulator